jgi:hypothetical protein
MQRRSFTSLACSTALAGLLGPIVGRTPVAAQAQASGVKGVLELFTSQGCSSCPAADALFEQYTKRSDLVALTFPVDYWDYLGWKDTLASAKFTNRQRAYAKTRGDGQIYTPQLVVNGQMHTNGADATSVDKLMGKVAADRARPWVPVQVASDNGQLVVAASALEGAKTGKAEVTVWVVTLSKRVEVMVRRGENAGKSLAYHNVVRDMNAVGMWNGDAMSVRLDRNAFNQKGEDACAILLQAGMAGPIIGAAMLPKL